MRLGAIAPIQYSEQDDGEQELVHSCRFRPRRSPFGKMRNGVRQEHPRIRNGGCAEKDPSERDQSKRKQDSRYIFPLRIALISFGQPQPDERYE